MKDLNIPILFPDTFPNGYVNDVMGWGNMTEEELHQKNDDGIYKLLTLDIDFGMGCSLKCPHCFKRTYNDNLGGTNKLTFDDYMTFIHDAKQLGLKYVKIVGAGEPFENKMILELLRYLTSLDIHTSIFTKGHVLGNDVLAKKYFSDYGIESAKQLVDELFKLKVSILLGCNSFEKETQGIYVGLQGNELDAFFANRNNALQLLCDAGFNAYREGVPTRLALIAAPFKTEYLKDILDIIKWARRRNIYTISCPTTESGDGRKEMLRVSGKHNDKFEEYRNAAIDFYVDIYKWSIANGIVKMEDFKKHGVSLYPGSHVCNQTACGLYVTYDGRVMQCPGFDNGNSLVGNDIRTYGIKQLWLSSPNYKRAMNESKYNFECIARVNAMHFTHDNFYSVIYNRVINNE